MADFNPRSSCEERRGASSVRGRSRHFNPRSSCEERHPYSQDAMTAQRFQSTLLMRGATRLCFEIYGRDPEFQSTLLMRGATSRSGCHRRQKDNFNPRSSCEERPGPLPSASTMARFQSTLLMRGATPEWLQATIDDLISIHAPHARSDHASRPLTLPSVHFNPRSSCEERLRSRRRSGLRKNFNPRSSCEERLASTATIPVQIEQFQSTLLMRGATRQQCIFTTVL